MIYFMSYIIVINTKMFYVDEYKNIENQIIMSLKNNNFFDWLFSTTIKPIHISTDILKIKYHHH